MDIIKEILPSTRHNRPGTKMIPTSITVHNTGNKSKGADALLHSSYIKNTDGSVSWHFTVDDQRIIQHIPIDEIAWHAGCKEGNSTSIGIEICMHEGIDMEKAEEKATWLIAHLMKETGVTEIKKHQDWTGKYCPAVILRENRWDAFKANCLSELYAVSAQDETHWAKPYYEQLNEMGIKIHEKRFNDPITRGEVLALICRILERT